MTKLVIVTFLFVAFLAAHVQSSKVEFPDAEKSEAFIKHTSCHEKEGITMELALEYSRERDNFDELYVKNPELKCFAACLYEFGNLMNGCSISTDDKFKEFVKQKPELEDFWEYMKGCNLNGTDRCECGYQLDKCFFEWLNKEDNE